LQTQRVKAMKPNRKRNWKDAVIILQRGQFV
jgi:hypothetical protein